MNLLGHHHRVLSLAAMMLCASSLFGCATKSHDEWMNNADKRWHSLRSTAMLEMARGQFEAGALDQAEKSVTEAAAIDATNPALHLLAGRISLERGELEKAYRLFQLSSEFNAEEPDAFFYQGVVLQRWQQYNAALEAYEKAYELDPTNPGRLLAVAETHVALDKIDSAVELLEGRKYYFDQNAGIRVMLGHLYRMRNEPKLAVENFRQATMLDQDNPRVLEELGLSQFEAGYNADAAATFNTLLERPEYANRNDLKRSLAKAETGIGRHKVAKEIYVQLTRDDPTNVNDWIRLGELCWKIEDLGGSLIAANRAITLSPRRHEGYLLSGLVWQKRGKIENALEMFDRAAELSPQNATPLILRGISLQKTDRPAAAAEAYTEALRRNPDDHRAERLLAQLNTQ